MGPSPIMGMFTKRPFPRASALSVSLALSWCLSLSLSLSRSLPLSLAISLSLSLSIAVPLYDYSCSACIYESLSVYVPLDVSPSLSSFPPLSLPLCLPPRSLSLTICVVPLRRRCHCMHTYMYRVSTRATHGHSAWQLCWLASQGSPAPTGATLGI